MQPNYRTKRTLNMFVNGRGYTCSSFECVIACVATASVACVMLVRWAFERGAVGCCLI